MTDDEEVLTESDLDVEELTLDDLKVEDEEGGKAKEGGLRAGGLGPSGSRYSPPTVPRKTTWKPIAAAAMLFIAAFLGLYIVVVLLTLEGNVEGETFDLYGLVLDDAEADKDREVRVSDLEVRVEGFDRVVMTDDDGEFEFPDIPGGKYIITFQKRSWDEAVNTKYITYIFADFNKDARYPFLVVTKDLDTNASEPVSDIPNTIEADLYYWKSDDTVVLNVIASSFDRDLTGYTVALSADGSTYQTYDEHPYDGNAMEFTFTDEDQSSLHAKLWDPDGVEYIGGTILELPAHPLGAGGWKGIDFPQVGTFVEHGTVFSGEEDVTIVVHSNDAVNYTLRVDGGPWEPWAALTDGGVKHSWTPDVSAGEHTLDFMTQNATGVNGTVSSVTITVDVVPPTLDPVRTQGDAVTSWAIFDLRAQGAYTMRYRLQDGGWSAWQLVVDEVVVPIDDTNKSATVTFEVMDKAGNRATATGTVNILSLQQTETDYYEVYKSSIRFCLPIMIIGAILAFLGGYMAFKRKRPTLAFIGCVGALIATGFGQTDFGLEGAIMGFLALALIMLSRDEFDQPAPAPEE